MIGIGFKINSAKGLFFDRKPVVDAVDRATRQVLSRFGAFVRQRARTSMKRRKGASPAGSPPYAHLGLIKQFLFFVFEAARRSVIIGPAQLNKATGDALEKLEYGGTATRRGQQVTYRARPFMRPAFQAELQGLPDLWRNSVK